MSASCSYKQLKLGWEIYGNTPMITYFSTSCILWDFSTLTRANPTYSLYLAVPKVQEYYGFQRTRILPACMNLHQNEL